jgi:RNA polymerase sigma-70 factor (ECF subfamily)
MGALTAAAAAPAARDPHAPQVLAALVENHRNFLAFLERRVDRREDAEEILQEAFVRGIDRLDSLRSGESSVAWFYRLLRNALSDHYRRRGAEARALERVAREPELPDEAPDEELMDTVCGCVGALVDTLQPQYAAALRRVDLEGAAVRAFAAEAGITANNAGVRLHRARLALRRQVEQSCGTCATHGCLDCTCGQPGAPAC